MKWAVATGIINDMDGKLNGTADVTRAQIAVIIPHFNELTTDLL